MESQSLWSFASVFFFLSPLILCFQSSFMQHEWEHLFLWPCNISLYGDTHFVYSLISSWTFGLFYLLTIIWIMLLWTFICVEVLVWMHISSFLVHIPRDAIAELYGKCLSYDNYVLRNKEVAPIYIPARNI